MFCICFFIYYYFLFFLFVCLWAQSPNPTQPTFRLIFDPSSGPTMALYSVYFLAQLYKSTKPKMPPLLRAAWRFFLFLHLLTITYSRLALFLSHAKMDKPFTPVCVQFLLHATCMKPPCHPLNYVMHFSFFSSMLEQPTTRHGRLS